MAVEEASRPRVLVAHDPEGYPNLNRHEVVPVDGGERGGTGAEHPIWASCIQFTCSKWSTLNSQNEKIPSISCLPSSLCLVSTHSVPNNSGFGISRFIAFVMHLNTYYIQILN